MTQGWEPARCSMRMRPDRSRPHVPGRARLWAAALQAAKRVAGRVDLHVVREQEALRVFAASGSDRRT